MHSPWREEIRATLALAWPLVLTNLAQAAIHATDVILLGRLGARQLAAGALGTNLMMACVVIASGLVMAGSPMTAKCQGWWLAPLGAVPAVRMQVSMMSRGTGRVENSRTVWRARISA